MSVEGTEGQGRIRLRGKVCEIKAATPEINYKGRGSHTNYGGYGHCSSYQHQQQQGYYRNSTRAVNEGVPSTLPGKSSVAYPPYYGMGRGRGRGGGRSLGYPSYQQQQQQRYPTPTNGNVFQGYGYYTPAGNDYVKETVLNDCQQQVDGGQDATVQAVDRIMASIEKVNQQIAWINDNPGEQTLEQAEKMKQQLSRTKEKLLLQLDKYDEQVSVS